MTSILLMQQVMCNCALQIFRNSLKNGLSTSIFEIEYISILKVTIIYLLYNL